MCFDHWPPDKTTWCRSAPVWLFSFQWRQRRRAPERGQACFSALNLPGRSSLSISGTVSHVASRRRPLAGKGRFHQEVMPGAASHWAAFESLRKGTVLTTLLQKVNTS